MTRSLVLRSRNRNRNRNRTRSENENDERERWKAAHECLTDPSEPVAELPIDPIAAGLPANLIQGDETILLLLKPHPLYIVLSCLGTLTLLAGIAAGSIWLQRKYEVEFDPRGMLGLCLLLAALRLSWQLFEWMSRTYVLTDRRVIRIMGVGRVQMFQAELRRIQHTEVLWTVRERVLGLGTISFSTAGKGIPEAYWVMVANPLRVHQKILHAITKYGR